MPYDISDIKKLSTAEKLQIIDELWETIDRDGANDAEESPEVSLMLQERIAKYEKGEGISYSWEEAKKILLSNVDKRKNGK